ncbi:MAG: PD-(D/E)XK nuclease family protein, partial [Oscillospiraceae bacterium]
VLDSENKSGEFFCMSKGMSFTYLAKTYFDDNQLTASLKEIFSQDDFYKSKIEMIEKINKKEPFEIKNSDNCKKIFDDKDKKMNISPTRVESFYQCAFRYFCQHGLRVYPLKKAELNPLETGTLIHKVLFDITKKYDLKNNFDEQKIKAEIKLELDVYIEQVMGGVKDKTKRFMYIYQKIRIQLFKILEHLHNEFEQSQFIPTDYEYEINENSDITPLKMVTNENIEVVISGKIDRIDSYVSQSGQKYIRIVDYKSGKKMFKLNDVLYGLNLQMLIYLFCIENNGKEKYKNCKPAGILYLHAGTIKPNLSRLSTQSQMEKEVKDFYKMNGLLVNETEVLEAMEKGIAGEYIPVSTKNDGTFSSQSLNSLASKQELGKISNYINKLIANMADELHYGKISASPLEGSCEYCDYASVCGKNQSEIEQYKKFEREEIFKQMENFSPEGDSNNG